MKEGGGIPECVYEPTLGLFRVLQMKGKAFMSGGFGIDMSLDDAPEVKLKINNFKKKRLEIDGARAEELVAEMELTASECREDSAITIQDSMRELVPELSQADADSVWKDTSDQKQHIYLFIEEALFLHDRGLLKVYHPNGITHVTSKTLFCMLERLSVPLPIYLTYAHLRSQTFIVLRHIDSVLEEPCSEISAFRATISQPEHEPSCDVQVKVAEGESSEQKNHNQSTTEKRKKRNRDEITDAKLERLCRLPLKMMCGKEGDRARLATKPTPPACITFDAYNPNSNFCKTNPGRPDFMVTVCSFFSHPLLSPTFSSIVDITESCRGVPLRIATVSDSGTVIMFGVSDAPVPSITKPEALQTC
jgi:hypothetical protein